jgi:glycosyltransferase involved in cell wall biosynthesis
VIVSALVPYKRVDVAIGACRAAGAPLRIVGKGPEEARLRALAGPDVEFLGWRSDDEIRTLYRRATAVLLPGVEDFGIVPVEAQACGTPVVALGRGGARETVLDGETGVLVSDDSVEALAEGLRRVQTMRVDREAVRRNAERFSRERFMTDFQTAIASAISGGPEGDGTAR